MNSPSSWSAWARGAGWSGHQILATAVVLAVAMGAGRFAFTAVYPVMVQDGLLPVLSRSQAAFLLSAVLVGAPSWARPPLPCRPPVWSPRRCPSTSWR